MYRLLFSPQAKKDAKNISSNGLKEKVNELLDLNLTSNEINEILAYLYESNKKFM